MYEYFWYHYHNFFFSLLKDFVNFFPEDFVIFFPEQLQNKSVLECHGMERKEKYSVTFHKGYKLFSCVHVNGEKAVLQGPLSAVELHIPEGLCGLISGHAHTDLVPFLDAIPGSECIVSPTAPSLKVLQKDYLGSRFLIV